MIATVTISNTSGATISSGTTVDTNSLPFDHAALVASLQSRADGYDFQLTDINGKRAGLVSLANPNTSTTRLVFNLVNTIVNGGSETYTLTHGDLGIQESPYVASINGNASIGMAVSWSTPQLPVPSFPFGSRYARQVDESPYPDTLSVRTNYRRNTPRSYYSISWASITPIEWYEIRAFVHSQRGGSGTFTQADASFLPNGTYAMIPSSASFNQSSRTGFACSLDVVEVLG